MRKCDKDPSTTGVWPSLKRCFLGIALFSAGIIATQSATAEDVTCESVFPTGVQSHMPNGQISFGWNAQLLNNPSVSLQLGKVNEEWSSLASCGSEPCSAGGGQSATLSLEIYQSSGTSSVQVPYRGKSVLSGAQDTLQQVTLASEAELSFEPSPTGYRIRDLTLDYSARLKLAPGDYWIETLTLASNVQIDVTGQGTARLYVKHPVVFPFQSAINMQSVNKPGDAGRLFIYSEADIQLQTQAQVSALVYTKKRLSLAQSMLYGSASFHHANLGSSAQIHYQADALANSELPAICNGTSTPAEPPIQEPSEPPPEDTEPVSACQAAWPNGLQVHAPDGQIHFHYNAQLHNAASTALHSPHVQVHGWSPQQSCVLEECTAQGTPVGKLNPGLFKTAVSSDNRTIPWAGTATLGANGTTEFGQIITAGAATLSFAHSIIDYRIASLHLGYNTTLELPAGDYWIGQLSLESEARIKAIGNGTVRLYVNSPLSLPWRSEINGNTEDPAKFVLYHYSGLTFQTGSRAHAMIYAAQDLELHNQAHVYGAATARNITLHTDSHLTYTPAAVLSADFGPVCEGTVVEPPDLTPPELIVSPPEPQTEDSSIEITGTVVDPIEQGSGVESVVASTETGYQISAILDGDSFRVTVPLSLGENLVTLTASDHSGNTSTEQVTVRRVSPPVFSRITPDSGSEYTEPEVQIHGQIHSAWPIGDLQFTLQGSLRPLTNVSEGVYSFAVNITLAEGRNTFELQVSNPDGSEQVTLELIYSAEDLTPPVLQVHNPDNQSVNTSTALITGHVTDPEQYGSGVQSVIVRSNRFGDTEFAAQLQEPNFQAEVPLAIGDNQLSITATDVSGNSTLVVLNIRRVSPPSISQVTPVNGAVIEADHVTINGVITTQQPLADVQFYINESQVTPSPGATEGQYTFNLPNVPLQLGQNYFLLRVVSPDGDADHGLTLSHRPDSAENLPAPELRLLEPLDGSLLSDPSFRLRGRVISHAGPVSVRLDGQLLASSGTSNHDYYFSPIVSFPEGEDIVSVTLEAEDSLGKVSALNASFYRDSQAPLILIDGFSERPAVNSVIESPVTIVGSVVDNNLASVMANGQPITLWPGSQENHYNFTFGLPISPGQTIDLALQARDLGGNLTVAEYQFRSAATAEITPLMPAEGTEFIGRDDPFELQVAARITAVEGASVRVSVVGSSTNLSVSGTLASGTVMLPGDEGSYTINYEMLNLDQHVIASASRQVSVNSLESIPLALSRHKPENTAQHIEPNQPVELHFNRSIDPGKLTVVVRETLHGETYVSHDPPGLDFLQARGYQLQQVHRDQEVVPGTISMLPGNQTAAFYPARHFGFNARVWVDVHYDGEELGRFTFQIKTLPTFVIGGVADQFGQPLPGIRVSLPDLGRNAVTNSDGSFAFGFLEQAEKPIPAGRHRLVINPEFANPRYGTQVRHLNVQERRRNDLSVSRLPALHPDIAFQLISSDHPQVSLAGNELQLDLSDAQLLFSNGRTSGNVQVQFTPFEQLHTAVVPGAFPYWAFATQPRGVRVEGRVGITMQVPALRGGYDYLQPDGYVVILGYDSGGEVIRPIGIGQLQNRQVTSVGKLPLETLDFIAFAQVDPRLQPELESVANGETSLQQLQLLLQQ